MKKLISCFIPALLAVVMWSCGGKPNPGEGPKAILNLDPATDIHFEAAGSSVTVSVDTDQLMWDAVSDQTWCEVEKGDKEFTVTAKANTSEDPMPQATITVTAGAEGNMTTVTLKATQAGYEPPKPINVEMTGFIGGYYGTKPEWENNAVQLILGFYNGQINGDNSDFTGDFEALMVICFNAFYEFEDLEVAAGTYTPDTTTKGKPKTYIPGNIVDNEALYTSYIKREGTTVTRYMVRSGDITLTKNGSEYTLDATLKAVDSAAPAGDQRDLEVSFTGSINDKFMNEVEEEVETIAN